MMKRKEKNTQPPAWFENWSKKVYQEQQPAWFEKWNQEVFQQIIKLNNLKTK